MNKINEFVVTAFYFFFNNPSFETQKDGMLRFCNEHSLKGTILIASEGINSTISGTRENINALYEFLKKTYNIKNFECKESFHPTQPFLKMKVRLKNEIVALRSDEVKNELDVEKYKGEYIEPKDWDEFTSRDDVIIVDTRNNYEIALGTFKNALNPDTKYFRQLPEWVEENLMQHKDKKIAMCCTGGIRCEKSTSYLKKLGFENVYHLKGGILQYFEDTKNQNQNWEGSCFVFDDRLALDANMQAIQDIKCKSCQDVITTDNLKRLDGLKPDFCPNCVANSNLMCG